MTWHYIQSTGLTTKLRVLACLIAGLASLAPVSTAFGATVKVHHIRKIARHRKHAADVGGTYQRLTPDQKQKNQRDFKSLRRAYYRFHHKGGVGGI